MLICLILYGQFFDWFKQFKFDKWFHLHSDSYYWKARL